MNRYPATKLIYGAITSTPAQAQASVDGVNRHKNEYSAAIAGVLKPGAPIGAKRAFVLRTMEMHLRVLAVVLDCAQTAAASAQLQAAIDSERAYHAARMLDIARVAAGLADADVQEMAAAIVPGTDVADIEYLVSAIALIGHAH